MKKNIPSAHALSWLVLLLAGLAVQTSVQAQTLTTAWISSEKDNTITLVDLAQGKVTATVPTCNRPRHMQLSADGKKIMVACSDSNAADIIDVATRQSVRRVPLGDSPEIFDVSVDGKTIFVSNEDGGWKNHLCFQ